MQLLKMVKVLEERKTPFFINQLRTRAGSCFTTLKQFIPTYSLQGKTFQNMKVFEVDRDEILERKYNCEGPNTTYYWAENVGLIKKDMGTCGYTWELIE